MKTPKMIGLDLELVQATTQEEPLDSPIWLNVYRRHFYIKYYRKTSWERIYAEFRTRGAPERFAKQGADAGCREEVREFFETGSYRRRSALD